MTEPQELLEGAVRRLDQIAIGVVTLSSQMGQLIEAMNRNTESTGRLILALAEGVDEDAELPDGDGPQYLNKR